MDDQTFDGLVRQAMGELPKKITPEMIESFIVSEVYFSGQEGVLGHIGQGGKFEMKDPQFEVPVVIQALNLLTVCVLVLRNGFTCVGTSSCVDPDSYDWEIGKKVARQNALNQVWPLMGVALKNAHLGIQGF